MPIDYKKYPPNWKAIRTKVLSRASNRCEQCGLKNHALVWSVEFNIRQPETGKYKKRTLWFSVESDAIRAGNAKEVRVVLTIAHLDHDETNWDVSYDRLKAMCQICHLSYDAKEKWRRLVSGHYDWQKEALTKGEGK